MVSLLIVSCELPARHSRRDWCVFLRRISSSGSCVWSEVVWLGGSVHNWNTIPLVHGVESGLWTCWAGSWLALHQLLSHRSVVIYKLIMQTNLHLVWSMPQLLVIVSSNMVILVWCIVVFEFVRTSTWAASRGWHISGMLPVLCKLLLLQSLLIELLLYQLLIIHPRVTLKRLVLIKWASSMLLPFFEIEFNLWLKKGVHSVQMHSKW